MCGIAGYVNLDHKPASIEVLRGMMSLQRHRGPDDQGMRFFSLRRQCSIEPQRLDVPLQETFEGAVGFNRLSILDLSDRGHQPMCNDTGRVFIAFNGEIYNAFDYTAELSAAGFRFRSRTDTEVILYLYERYGIEETLERLNGMFAFVIVDLEQRQVHAARDHLGIKPFYWAAQNGVFLFASEAKSFAAHPDFRCELEPANLDEYLTFRYCAGARHLLKDVFQLPPGHRLRFGRAGIEVQQYWDIPDRAVTPPPTFEEGVHRLDLLLRRSVRSQLLSDVKVGCQLSGGIDSSLVTLFARSHCDADMDAFSIVFEDERYSEGRWISQAAVKARVDSHRFIFRAESFCESLEQAAWHLDQPLSHPNSLGIYLLSQKARKLVTVLLSGEGADELFGGYGRFYQAVLRGRLLWLRSLRHLPGIGRRFRNLFGMGLPDAAASFIAASCYMEVPDLIALHPDGDFRAVIEKRRELFSRESSDFVHNCLKYEMQTHMPDLLVRQDKMTMAHSLENRVPFLDRDLVNFVRTLPTEHLVGAQLLRRDSTMRNTKRLLKELARREFGDEFTFRPKCGFGLPLSEFYQEPRFEQLMEDQILPGLRGRQIVECGPVHNWWRNRRLLRPPLQEALWIPVALELWAQKVLKKPEQTRPLAK